MAERASLSLQNVSRASEILLPITALLATLWLWWSYYSATDNHSYRRSKKKPSGPPLSVRDLHKYDFSAVDWSGPMPDEALLLLEHIANPGAFRSCTLSRQILLVGPPGTGKTKFARILCNQVGGVYYELNAAELDETFVGVGPARLRNLFQEAISVNEHSLLARCYYALTNTTPTPRPVVIFIDELDVIGRRMHGLEASVTHGTISQLLTLLDSLADHPQVFFVGATNHRHLIDGAILRAGRITQEIYFDYPSSETRTAFLRSLLQTFRNDDPQLYVHEEDVLSFARLPGTEIWTIEDCRDFLLKAMKRARQRHARAIREENDTALITMAVEVTMADLEYAYSLKVKTRNGVRHSGSGSSSETTPEDLD